MSRYTPYAHIQWVPDDVKTLRPSWTFTKCEEFLAKNERRLQERLIELGWEVMETLIAEEVSYARAKQKGNERTTEGIR